MNKSDLAAALREHYDGQSGDADEKTKAELYEEAKDRDVEGRSKMTKEELAEAVG